ncbi:MAG: phosphoadenosine phosphosulfate reductase [Alphaproteobacteria bacterium]|jgi:phosphoadenosine phosphosulfate reductase
MTDQDLVAHIETARVLLAEAALDHAPAVLATSLGAEDMVLLDLIARDRLPVRAFVLDTQRLPEETLALLENVKTRYRTPIDIFTPEPAAMAAFDAAHGSDGIFKSVEIRKSCCHLRKVEPLARALDGKGAWITGLRRSQSAERAAIAEKGWDADHGLFKFNPLADWSSEEIWAYIHDRKVPYNPLHDQGYPSIGCAPCSRAIKPGEDERAGRWWWEINESSECGLHPSSPSGV